MKFALIDGNKTEAFKGAKGICPSCGSELIAKCGEVKINHWSHKGNRNCDPWWENETEWHRSWKNNFPVECQEFSIIDFATKEKHIADVRTNDGLVIEFQHSHIDPKERRIRENFYKNMVWVVDGTRLKNDYKRFLNGMEYYHLTNQNDIQIDAPELLFPSSWIGSAVPVIFDFWGNESIDNPNDIRNSLYCLFPNRIGRSAVIAKISRNFFIKTNEWILWARNSMDNINQLNKKWQIQQAQQQRLQDNIIFAKYSMSRQYRRRIRGF